MNAKLKTSLMLLLTALVADAQQQPIQYTPVQQKQSYAVNKYPLSPLVYSQAVALNVMKKTQADNQPNTQWQLYSQVKSAGLEILKFQYLLEGVPIMGDWAMVILNDQRQPLRMAQSVSVLDHSQMYQNIDVAAMWPIIQPSVHSTYKPIKPIWFKDNKQLIPAYVTQQTTFENQQPVVNALVHSAADGQLLAKAPLTYRAAYNYKVFADSMNTPADSVYGSTQPHPTGMPDDIQPSMFATQNIINVETTSTKVDDPWLPVGATETLGNNVDIFFNSLLLPDGTYDNNFSDGKAYGPEFQPDDGDFRAQLNGVSTFDFTYDPSISANDFYQLFSDPTPSNPSPNDPQINAKLVQGFYMANVMRDFFYDAGFTEVAGNAQHDNYNRGGIENDRMIIHGNCLSTFVFTPEDGVQPVMCLGRNSSSATNKDASFDYSIFAHEWSHYMYKRLVQGPSIPTGNQGRSLNEGWADLVGIFMTLNETDFNTPNAPGFNSVYTVGGYFNTDYAWRPIYDPTGTLPDAHFYGIRRWPYGASNPLTFKHIEHLTSLPNTLPYFDWKGRSKFNSEYHSAGEIWATTTWDCFRSILGNRTDRTFHHNRTQLGSYIVAGMAATPPDPTFTEARDGLLLAINQADQLDWQLCRQAFADRGLGSGALSPERFSTTHQNVVESYDNDDLHMSVVLNGLSDDIISFDGDGLLDEFETGNLSLTVKNTGFTDIEVSTIELISSADFIFNPAPNEIFNLAVGAEVELQIPIKLLHNRQFDWIEITLVIALSSDNGNTSGGGDAVLNFRTNYNLATTTNPIETLDFADALSLWSESTLYQWPYIDPHFETVSMDTNPNKLLRIGEVYGGFEKTLTSPWLGLDSNNPEFNMGIDHTYVLGVIGQVLRIEYSFDELNWFSMTTQSNNPAEYLADDTNYPTLSYETLSIPAVIGDNLFKIRFYINAFTDFTPNQVDWLIDNISISGVTELPFMAVTNQGSNDLIFMDDFEP